MNANANNDLFRFRLTPGFVPKELEDRYMIALEYMKKPYASVLDYINSTIKSITMPSITLPTVVQTVGYGKKITYRGSQAPNDVFGQDLNITFKLVDSGLNWQILQDMLLYFYSNPDVVAIKRMTLTTLDINRRELFKYTYSDLIIKSLSDNTLAFNDKDVNEKDITMGIAFNWIDIEFIPKYGSQAPQGEIIDKYTEQIENPDTSYHAPRSGTGAFVDRETGSFVYSPIVGKGIADYEFTANGDDAYRPLPFDAELLENGNIQIPMHDSVFAQDFKVRLKAVGEVPAGLVLTNDFTYVQP